MDGVNYFQRFGSALDPIQKDEVPAKKPVAIEDQIVKDENGKRRFHGAFTGGFSAGFWNTVGSLEGWTPQNFKSSRTEKGTRVQQRPEDFMDKEDLGEFGIAPQGICTREEFVKQIQLEHEPCHIKHKFMQPDVSAPIPGVPVLQQLLRPIRDNVAVHILKSMGWKVGQGIGKRQTRREKRLEILRNKRQQYLLEHYGDEGLTSSKKQLYTNADNDEDEEEEEEEEEYNYEHIAFAPNDYEPMFYTPKNNRFGMNYTGLSREPVLSNRNVLAAPMQHINFFKQQATETQNKKFSLHGQAFGVGAFEEEDEDIYAPDDITRYDFSLADKKPKQRKAQLVQQRHVIDGFSEDKGDSTNTKPYTFDLPRDFEPRNWLVRRSRFTPLDAQRAHDIVMESEYKRAGFGRHALKPDQRAIVLGETHDKKEYHDSCQPKQSKLSLDYISKNQNKLSVSGLTSTTSSKQSAGQFANKTKSFATFVSGFKPFSADETKQLRYEKFLAANLKDDADITEFLAEIQPVTFSLWDRELEKKEFVQAAKIYRPLAGLMSNRFISEASVNAQNNNHQIETMKRDKIVMLRKRIMWKPSALLCIRYNIAEPLGGTLQESEKELNHKSKMGIFDYLETSMNTKSNFHTPCIIPKHIDLRNQQKEAHLQETLQNLKTSQKIDEEMIDGRRSTEEKDLSEPGSPLKVKRAFLPRTPLEQAVDAARFEPISEKISLFKSIFEDSEEEEKAVELDQQQTAVKSKAIQPDLRLPSSKISSAAAANLLRNDSPPRGVFVSLFKPPEDMPLQPSLNKYTAIEHKLKIPYKSREERLNCDKELAVTEVPQTMCYGPRLPSRIDKPTTQQYIHTEAGINANLPQQGQHKASRKRKAYEWVERTLASTNGSDVDSSNSSTETTHSKVKKSKSKKSHKKSKKNKKMVKEKSKKGEKTKHSSKKKESKH